MEKEKSNMKFFKLLNDEVFWTRYSFISLSPYAVKRLREYRSKSIFPTKKLMKNFLKDYRIVMNDERTDNEIILDLMSEVID